MIQLYVYLKEIFTLYIENTIINQQKKQHLWIIE